MNRITWIWNLFLASIIILVVVPLPAFALFENLGKDDQVKYFNALMIFAFIVFWLIVNQVPWYVTVGFLVLCGWLGMQIWPNNYIWLVIVNTWNWMVDNTYINPNARL
jgi:hypothetical protein